MLSIDGQYNTPSVDILRRVWAEGNYARDDVFAFGGGPPGTMALMQDCTLVNNDGGTILQMYGGGGTSYYLQRTVIDGFAGVYGVSIDAQSIELFARGLEIRNIPPIQVRMDGQVGGVFHFEDSSIEHTGSLGNPALMFVDWGGSVEMTLDNVDFGSGPTDNPGGDIDRCGQRLGVVSGFIDTLAGDYCP